MITLSDNAITFNSDCAKCKNYKVYKTCPAYPNGIPKELTNGKEKHRTVRPEQKGTTIFESIVVSILINLTMLNFSVLYLR